MTYFTGRVTQTRRLPNMDFNPPDNVRWQKKVWNNGTNIKYNYNVGVHSLSQEAQATCLFLINNCLAEGEELGEWKRVTPGIALEKLFNVQGLDNKIVNFLNKINDEQTKMKDWKDIAPLDSWEVIITDKKKIQIKIPISAIDETKKQHNKIYKSYYKSEVNEDYELQDNTRGIFWILNVHIDAKRNKNIGNKQTLSDFFTQMITSFDEQDVQPTCSELKAMDCTNYEKISYGLVVHNPGKKKQADREEKKFVSSNTETSDNNKAVDKKTTSNPSNNVSTSNRLQLTSSQPRPKIIFLSKKPKSNQPQSTTSQSTPMQGGNFN